MTDQLIDNLDVSFSGADSPECVEGDLSCADVLGVVVSFIDSGRCKCVTDSGVSEAVVFKMNIKFAA